MTLFWVMYLVCAVACLAMWARQARGMIKDGVDPWVIVIPVVTALIPGINVLLAIFMCYYAILQYSDG